MSNPDCGGNIRSDARRKCLQFVLDCTIRHITNIIIILMLQMYIRKGIIINRMMKFLFHFFFVRTWSSLFDFLFNHFGLVGYINCKLCFVLISLDNNVIGHLQNSAFGFCNYVKYIVIRKKYSTFIIKWEECYPHRRALLLLF